jgi:iron(III) transport system substrate-binding protein
MNPSHIPDPNVSSMLRLSALLSLAALVVAAVGCSESKPKVVLYSAQDPEFAEEVLPEFTQQTGIHVATKYDTEANKSVSLYAELIQEKNRPRCDVHWNNEILATIRLQRQGLLEPYESPAAATYPTWTKAKDHTWQAFASRARVLLVNTQMIPDPKKRPHSLLDLTDARWKGKVGMAKPQFGTTATQAACLFEVLGSDKAKEFYRGLKKNDVQLVAGNKQAAQGVSQGQFAVGMTDTDDAIIEVLAGKPVTIILPDRDGHPDHPRMGTLFIPNTLAVIRACPNPEGARKLVDYLLGSPVEKKLAESESHQIPLNPNVQAALPKEIERPQGAGGPVKPMQVDFEKATDLWEEVQSFLRNEIAGG